MRQCVQCDWQSELVAVNQYMATGQHCLEISLVEMDRGHQSNSIATLIDIITDAAAADHSDRTKSSMSRYFYG